MNNLDLVLYVLAFVLFLVAGAGYPKTDSPYGGRLVALGLACWVATLIF